MQGMNLYSAPFGSGGGGSGSGGDPFRDDGFNSCSCFSGVSCSLGKNLSLVSNMMVFLYWLMVQHSLYLFYLGSLSFNILMP
jgi:hypothetical protein